MTNTLQTIHIKFSGIDESSGAIFLQFATDETLPAIDQQVMHGFFPSEHAPEQGDEVNIEKLLPEMARSGVQTFASNGFKIGAKVNAQRAGIGNEKPDTDNANAQIPYRDRIVAGNAYGGHRSDAPNAEEAFMQKQFDRQRQQRLNNPAVLDDGSLLLDPIEITIPRSRESIYATEGYEVESLLFSTSASKGGVAVNAASGESFVDTLYAFNDRQNIEGTYNVFSAMIDAAEIGNWNLVKAHYNYSPSPEARQAIHNRINPPPTAFESKVDRIRGSSLGGAAFAISSLSDADTSTQEMFLELGTATDGIAMARAGLAGRAPRFTGAESRISTNLKQNQELASEMLKPYSGVERMRMGNVFESIQFDKISAQGTFVRQLKVRAFDGDGKLLPGTTNLDAIGYNNRNELIIYEMKLSVNSPLTSRQQMHQPNLMRNGFVVEGNNGGASFAKGSVHLPTNINYLRGGPQ